MSLEQRAANNAVLQQSDNGRRALLKSMYRIGYMVVLI
jgi:hypothetical protein